MTRKGFIGEEEGEPALFRAIGAAGFEEEQALFRANGFGGRATKLFHKKIMEGSSAGGVGSTLGILVMLMVMSACAANAHVAMFEGHLGISCGTTERSVVLILKTINNNDENGNGKGGLLGGEQHAPTTYTNGTIKAAVNRSPGSFGEYDWKTGIWTVTSSAEVTVESNRLQCYPMGTPKCKVFDRLIVCNYEFRIRI